MWRKKTCPYYYPQGCRRRTPRQGSRPRETQLHSASTGSPLGGGHITYVGTWEGWLYLSFVLDAFSRKVVGWSMANHLKTELVLDALNMALYNRRPAPGLIHHSDRGSQYTSG
jgi:putative transposase